MKKIAFLAAVSLAFVGCEQQRIDEASGSAKDQIEQQAKAEKQGLERRQDSIEQSAEQAKDDISAQAKAEKERIESQAEAQKAQIEAEKKSVEAQAESAKADIEAQQETAEARQEAQEEINEAAGATTGLTAQDQGTSEADRKITMEIRQSITTQATPTDLSTSAKNVTIITKDGMVTLKGTVHTEAEKADLEARAKAVSGVKSVDNKLEVKSQ